MNCVHEIIPDSLSRLTEAHWYIHRVEEHYHNPDPFRYSVNAYIRAVKEIPIILSMELQNKKGFANWFKIERSKLNADPLISLLSTKRDFIVHHGELDFHSKGFFGVARNRSLKFGVALPIYPTESSVEAYERYIQICKDNEALFKLIKPHEDQYPCIERSWILKEFPDKDLLSVIIESWNTTSALVSNVLIWLGGEHQDLTLNCVHRLQDVQLKFFSREDFIDRVRSTH